MTFLVWEERAVLGQSNVDLLKRIQQSKINSTLALASVHISIRLSIAYHCLALLTIVDIMLALASLGSIKQYNTAFSSSVRLNSIFSLVISNF